MVSSDVGSFTGTFWGNFDLMLATSSFLLAVEDK